MLKIDMTAGIQKPPLNPQATSEKLEMNPTALNQYNSLNRKVRIQNLTKIVSDNKSMLNRLQSAKSHYSRGAWENQFQNHKTMEKNINTNGNRFSRNPYFLHSVCTPNETSVQQVNNNTILHGKPTMKRRL